MDAWTWTGGAKRRVGDAGQRQEYGLVLHP